jgi:hypothetical protein
MREVFGCPINPNLAGVRAWRTQLIPRENGEEIALLRAMYRHRWGVAH